MKKLALGAVALLASAWPAQAATVYSTNFTDPPTIAAGVVVTPFTNGGLEVATAGAWNAAGWSGNYFANRSGGNPAAMSVLTLSNLAPHSMIDVSFVLGFLESWDSTNGTITPDFLDIFIDGLPVLTGLTANNASGSFEIYGGGTELFDGVQANSNNFFSDTLVDMSSAGALSFAHSSSTLTFGIRAYGGGWQGAADEGWGIDQLSITFDSVVPEPATWGMMIVGFGLVGAMLRRRRVSRGSAGASARLQ